MRHDAVSKPPSQITATTSFLWISLMAFAATSQHLWDTSNVFQRQDAKDAIPSSPSMKIYKMKFPPFSSAALRGFSPRTLRYHLFYDSSAEVWNSRRERHGAPLCGLMEHEVDLSYKCWCNQRTPITCEMQTVPMDGDGGHNAIGDSGVGISVSENSDGICYTFSCTVGFLMCSSYPISGWNTGQYSDYFTVKPLQQLELRWLINSTFYW